MAKRGVGRAKASDEREEAFTKLELQKDELEAHAADGTQELEDANKRVDDLEEVNDQLRADNDRLSAELKADGHVFHYHHHK